MWHMSSLARALLIGLALACHSPGLHAEPACAGASNLRKSAEPIVDWYENYVRPYRSMPGGSGPASLTKSEVEAFIGEIAPFHRQAVLDPLFFETLVQQLTTRYAREPGFKGLDTATAARIHKSGVGQKLDFSMVCISPKTLRSPDDAFAITLFGVVADDCQHIGLRGLVFTATLVNGSANGQCRPDQQHNKLIFVPLSAGTNEISFVCVKDQGGCARQ